MRPFATRRLLASTILSPLLVVTVTAGLLVGAAPSATAAPATTRATTLTLSVPAGFSAGRAVTVTGTLRAQPAAGSTKTTAVKAATVTVRWRTTGRHAWTSTTTAVTTDKGTWSAKIKGLQLNTDVKASFTGTTTRLASTSPVASALAAQSISTVTTPSRPRIGQLLMINGSTSAALVGTTLRLQRLTSDGWQTLTTVPVQDDATYRTSLRVSSSSAVTIRLRSGKRLSIQRTYGDVRTVYPYVTGTLANGDSLRSRWALTSPNGLYTATMQRGGALVVTDSVGTELWSSGTARTGATVALGSNGNLVISGPKGNELWSTGSEGRLTNLVLQNDGNLVVFSKGHALWSSMKGLGGKVLPATCWSTSFDCISFSSYNPNRSYWAMYSGHNCTNYAAYRMIAKGVEKSPWGLPGGSAWEWRANAKKVGIRVDKNPVVGAIMQWNRYTNGGGSSGHVTYVEKVTDRYVVISEDSWSGHSGVRTIDRSSDTYAAARFIHIKDAGSK